jgi:PilZ domain
MDVWEDSGEFAARRPERRSDLRYSVDEDSIVLFVGHGAPQEAHLVDLSQDGCRLRTTEPITARSRLPVEVFFTIEGISFRFRSVLQWTDGHHLVGIRFVNTMPQRLVELASVICKMEKTAATRADVVNLLIAKHKAEQSTGRQATVWADEPSRVADRGHVGDPSHVGEPGRGPVAKKLTKLLDFAPLPQGEAKQPATGRERRGHARHELDTTAMILLPNVESSLHGRILDLSLTGCRIRTDERFPVGIYTRVETDFRPQGLPFRLGGVIQAIHERNIVGIRFLDINEQKREQVSGLIGEIEQSQAELPGPAVNRI